MEIPTIKKAVTILRIIIIIIIVLIKAGLMDCLILLIPKMQMIMVVVMEVEVVVVVTVTVTVTVTATVTVPTRVDHNTSMDRNTGVMAATVTVMVMVMAVKITPTLTTIAVYRRLVKGSPRGQNMDKITMISNIIIVMQEVMSMPVEISRKKEGNIAWPTNSNRSHDIQSVTDKMQRML
jgi:hypothetical protein